MWRCSNYEPVEGGYRRTTGYERFDGRPRPSEAVYWILAFDGTVTTAPANGATITGASSGATAIVLDTVDSTYILGEVTGVFQDNEALNPGAGDANGIPLRLGAETVDLDLEYRDLAAAHRRTTIQKVPGSAVRCGASGPTRACSTPSATMTGTIPPRPRVMHKATAMGWDRSFPRAADFLRRGRGGARPPARPLPAPRPWRRPRSATSCSIPVPGPLETPPAPCGSPERHGTFQDDENLQQSISGTDTTVAVADGTETANTRFPPAGATSSATTTSAARRRPRRCSASTASARPSSGTARPTWN